VLLEPQQHLLPTRHNTASKHLRHAHRPDQVQHIKLLHEHGLSVVEQAARLLAFVFVTQPPPFLSPASLGLPARTECFFQDHLSELHRREFLCQRTTRLNDMLNDVSYLLFSHPSPLKNVS